MSTFHSARMAHWTFVVLLLSMHSRAPIQAQGTAPDAYQLSFEAPSEVNSFDDTAEFEVAAILITNPDVESGALGWSIGISGAGCVIASATTAGTSGDLEANGGLRKDGDSFEFTELVMSGGGVVSGVALSFSEEVVLDPASSPHTILNLRVEAAAPSTSGECNQCALSFVDGLVGSGEPVDNEVTVVDESVPALLLPTTIDVCRSAFQFSFTAPAQIITADTAEFDAAVVLTTDLSGTNGAQGWTLSIASTGCVLTDATTAGTAGDLADNGGFRKSDDSFEFTELILSGGGAVSGVALSFTEDVVLPPDGSPHAVLNLRVQATAPSSEKECGQCALSYVDGLSGSGEPAENEVTLLEKAVTPALEPSTIDVCLDTFEATFGLSLDAPATVAAAVPGATTTGDVTALLSTNLDGAIGAQGWTTGLSANGCTVASAATAGTAGALEADGGFRKQNDSFELTEIIPGGGGVISRVALSFSEEVMLPSAAGPHTILRFQIEATGPNPSLGCSECILSYVDGLVGSGEAVHNEITLLNDAVVPTLGSATIDICTTPFELSFEAPTQVDEGPFSANAVLDATFIGAVGAQGWSIGVAPSGCDIAEATTSGTAAEVEDNGGFRKSDDGFELTELTTGPGNEGAVSRVTLSVSDSVTLPPTIGPHTVLRLTVDVTVPDAAGDCVPCALSYTDGLAGTSSPIDNEILFLGALTRPALRSTTVDICNTSVVSGQIPGDVNHDGRIDIADPVRLAGFLFVGSTDALPCGDGSNFAPGNVQLADWNGDGRNDIADIVGGLGWLFRGKAAHILDTRGDGSSCVPMTGCADVCVE